MVKTAFFYQYLIYWVSSFLFVGIFLHKLTWYYSYYCLVIFNNINGSSRTLMKNNLWGFCDTGNIVLEAAILTSVVTIGLTLYTFWAAKRGYDFNFLGPFLFASLLVLLVFSLIQVSRTLASFIRLVSIFKNYTGFE